RLGLGDLGSDDQLAGQLLRAALAERKGEDVRRLVVVEVALVELVNRRIVDERQTDLVVGDGLTLQHGAHDLAQLPAVDRDEFLRTGNGDLAHRRPRFGDGPPSLIYHAERGYNLQSGSPVGEAARFARQRAKRAASPTGNGRLKTMEASAGIWSLS